MSRSVEAAETVARAEALPVASAEAVHDTSSERQRLSEQPLNIHTAPRWLLVFNPFSMFMDIWRHRYLIRQLAWRQVVTRYKGSYFGLLWSFVTPLVTLLMYSFVFNVVFKARWGKDPSEGYGDYTLAMFCGLAVFSVFSESVSRSPTVILENVNLVKRVIFPLQILPVASTLGSLVNAIFSFIVLFGALYVFHGTIPLSALMLPLILLPTLAFALGISWFLSSTGVFIRDMQQTVALIMQLLFFMTPIFYPLSSVPEGARRILELNPFATLIGQARDCLVWGKELDWKAWGITFLVSLVIMQLGYAWFMKTKRAFADVV